MNKTETASSAPAELLAPDESLLLRLRQAAMVERNELTRFQMREAADNLSIAIGHLNEVPTTLAMQNLNGRWMVALRVLGRANGSPDDGQNGSGLKDGALLAVAA